MTYIEFINNILESRGRFNCDGYCERHHIIPRCLGGTNDDDNLIELYPSEHYLAHKLLALENKSCNELTYSWHRLHYDKKREVEITQQEYSVLKENLSKALKTREVSPETRKKQGDSRRGCRNGMYGKENKWGHHSELSKKKISESNSGENNPMYGKPGTRTGMKNSDYTRKRVSESQSIPVIDLTTGKEYYCCSEAALDLGCTCATISHHCKNGKPYKGHFLKYKEGGFILNDLFRI